MEQSSQSTAEHWQRTWDTYDENDPRAVITREAERRRKGEDRGWELQWGGAEDEQVCRRPRKPAHSGRSAGTGDKGGSASAATGRQNETHTDGLCHSPAHPSLNMCRWCRRRLQNGAGDLKGRLGTGTAVGHEEAA